MSDPLTQLKERLTKVTDLERIGRILHWDLQTMMPPAGSDHRAEHLATLRRISHELLTDDETGRLLDELRPLEESLDADSDDGALIRLARRDFEKAVRVPADLRVEMTRAAAQARPIWVKARAESSFEQFLPALEHNVELRRQYVAGAGLLERSRVGGRVVLERVDLFRREVGLELRDDVEVDDADRADRDREEQEREPVLDRVRPDPAPDHSSRNR